MTTLCVKAQRCEECEIVIGEGAFSTLEKVDFVFTDTNVYRLYQDKIQALGVPVFVMQAGEEHKNEQTLFALIEAMKDADLHRNNTVACIGGGVVCDVGGLASALYMRGISCVYVPTTLLAQVDASVGGKTAIDFCGVKNLVGVFAQPRRVIVDPVFLSTLPQREIRCGLGEMVKHAALNGELFDKLIENKRDIFDLNFIQSIMSDNIRFKADVVARDAYEKGVRACLNLGHTTAHAVELASDLSHGECVLVGMIIEASIAPSHCACDGGYLERLKRLCRLVLGGTPALPKAKEVAPLARLDKKNVQKDSVTLTVPTKRGEYEILNLPYLTYEKELIQKMEEV